MVITKRIYETASREDGYRVLVDRLWPRGMTKDKANVNAWLKEVAPSGSLRRWYNHEPEKWAAFKTKYKSELKDKSDLLEKLKALEHQHGTISLLYAAKDEARNQAIVLQEVLDTLTAKKA